VFTNNNTRDQCKKLDQLLPNNVSLIIVIVITLIMAMPSCSIRGYSLGLQADSLATISSSSDLLSECKYEKSG